MRSCSLSQDYSQPQRTLQLNGGEAAIWRPLGRLRAVKYGNDRVIGTMRRLLRLNDPVLLARSIDMHGVIDSDDHCSYCGAMLEWLLRCSQCNVVVNLQTVV